MLPVVIVSGYLGAGKTTLIREFLTDPQGLRATVLVNDFGQINLDAELIAATGTDTIALTNGCACCSIGDDLLGAAQTAVSNRPDLLVVETSGVAQPARLASLLHGIAGVQPARCLTVVNLSRAQQLASDKFVGTLFRQQTDQAQALSVNRPGNGTGIERDLIARPLVANLHEFIRTSGRVDPPTVPDAEPSPEFTQTIHRPAPMTEADLKGWLTRLSPNAHRAKGPVPMLQQDGTVKMAWLDFVQGQFCLRLLPERPVSPAGQVVVIGPAGR